jgi:hypothetical protein
LIMGRTVIIGIGRNANRRKNNSRNRAMTDHT